MMQDLWPMIRQTTVLRGIILAGLVFLASSPAASEAQTDASPSIKVAKRDAAHLEFERALDHLSLALKDDPGSVSALRQLSDIHRKLNRPGLAANALTEALKTTPGSPELLTERAEVWLSAGQTDRAFSDLATALAADPDNSGALKVHARALKDLGIDPQAQDHLPPSSQTAENPSTITPTPKIVQVETEEPPRSQSAGFPSASLMKNEFTIFEGVEMAPNDLVFVHSAKRLEQDFTTLSEVNLMHAVTKGQIKITHLFTYSGEDSSVWGNLALICAGPKGFAAASRAMRSEPGQIALRAVEKSGGLGIFRSFLQGAYAAAGIDPELVESCALDRAHALRYLQDWNAKYETQGWNGENLYETAPQLILNAAPISATSLNDWLGTLEGMGDQAHSPARDAPLTDSPPISPPELGDVADALGQVAPNTDQQDPILAARAPEVDVETAPAPVAAPILQPLAEHQIVTPFPDPTVVDIGHSQSVEQSENVLPKSQPTTSVLEAAGTSVTLSARSRPVAAEGQRLPPALRGIWSTSVAGCIEYDTAMATAKDLNASIPAIAPLSNSPGMTILITSRILDLRNSTETECGLSRSSVRDDLVQAEYSCSSPLVPSRSSSLSMRQIQPRATPPRIEIQFGEESKTEFLQCRTLGQVGANFAPLWRLDDSACSVLAPLGDIALFFQPGKDESISVKIIPGRPVSDPGALPFDLSIDGLSLANGTADRDSLGWTISLGKFDKVADAISQGMFLDISTTGGSLPARVTLPLLGSGSAMKALEACRTTQGE